MLQLINIFSLSTVEDNKYYFSSNEIEESINSIKTQQIIG